MYCTRRVVKLLTMSLVGYSLVIVQHLKSLLHPPLTIRNIKKISVMASNCPGGSGSGSSGCLLPMMQAERQRATGVILEAKRVKGVTWEDIAKAVGRSPVWVTSCCLGENSMEPEVGAKLCSYLGVEDGGKTTGALSRPCPLKGGGGSGVDEKTLLQDPCIYRFHEVNLVYGLTLKELIQEKFGDGIMSAIDFTMELEKEEDPKGDRVRIIWSGKFLPYKKW